MTQFTSKTGPAYSPSNSGGCERGAGLNREGVASRSPPYLNSISWIGDLNHPPSRYPSRQATTPSLIYSHVTVTRGHRHSTATGQPRTKARRLLHPTSPTAGRQTRFFAGGHPPRTPWSQSCIAITPSREQRSSHRNGIGLEMTHPSHPPLAQRTPSGAPQKALINTPVAHGSSTQWQQPCVASRLAAQLSPTHSADAAHGTAQPRASTAPAIKLRKTHRAEGRRETSRLTPFL